MATVARTNRNFEHAYLRDLAVKERPITDLLPLNRRARRHRRKQIQQIARSIETFTVAFRSILGMWSIGSCIRPWQSSATGQIVQSGLRLRQIVAPSSIIA